MLSRKDQSAARISWGMAAVAIVTAAGLALTASGSRAAQQMAAIDDLAIIQLRAPGGKRIEAPTGPLKAIVGAMVDLLTDPTRKQRQEGDPLRLGAWEARRIEALRAEDSTLNHDLEVITRKLRG